MANKTLSKFQTGFTLTELLIVIAILVVLAAAVVVVLNPGELLAQARDSRRVGELNSLAQAIALHANPVIGGYRGTENRVYISLPDSSATCANLLANLPVIPSGWSYRCATAANLRRSDGAGWLPHNFNAMPGGSPFDRLPIDPVNSATYYYAFVTGEGWALSSLLESDRHLRTNALQDGGTDPGRIEIGTNRGLWTSASRLISWWPLNGDFLDAAIINQPWQIGNRGWPVGGVSFAVGKQSQAGNFDGVDDAVRVPGLPSLDTDHITLEAWVRANAIPATTTNSAIMSKGAMWSLAWQDTQLLTLNLSIESVRHTLSVGPIDLRTDWHHIVGTYDGTIMRIYINGVERGTYSVSGPMDKCALLSAVIIGSAGVASPLHSRFNGLIDEARIYNRALTAAEVLSAYNATK